MLHPTRAVIASDNPLTTAAGVRLAREGGNAVDIAVGAGLAASLSEIMMCSIGGSAFLMVAMPGEKPELIDGADAMPGFDPNHDPSKARWREAFLPYGAGIIVRIGHGTVAVPGMLSALETAWKRHGRLPWAEIIAPALDLARDGFSMGVTAARWLSEMGAPLFLHQDTCRRCFFPNGDDRTPTEGEPFHIPDLDQTLEQIAREGARAFYEGEIAARFAREMEEHGGLVTRADLASYRAIVREPLTLQSQGFTLALNPPPSVGGAALGSLIGLLERGWSRSKSAAEWALVLAQAQAYLLRLREETISDPNLSADEAQALLHPDILRQHWNRLQSPSTTHLSVVTSDGGLVALTMSNGYNSGIVIPGTGILCNNSLGEPELNPRGFYASRPGARMVSNMAPTIAMHPDGRRLALGSPGASRITTSLAQVWSRFAFEGLDLDQAINAPRLHVDPDFEAGSAGLRVFVEPGVDISLLPETFSIHHYDQFNMFFGAVKVAALEPEGRMLAVADGRREGAIEFVG